VFDIFGGGSRRGARGPLKGAEKRLDRKPSSRRAERLWHGVKEHSASRSLAVSVGPLGLADVKRLSKGSRHLRLPGESGQAREGAT